MSNPSARSLLLKLWMSQRRAETDPQNVYLDGDVKSKLTHSFCCGYFFAWAIVFLYLIATVIERSIEKRFNNSDSKIEASPDLYFQLCTINLHRVHMLAVNGSKQLLEKFIYLSSQLRPNGNIREGFSGRETLMAGSFFKACFHCF